MKYYFDDLFDSKKISKCDFLIETIKKLEHKHNEKYTLLAICPNSKLVIKAAIESAKKNNAPLIFAATLNQIDTDGGYTKLNFKEFVQVVKNEINDCNFSGPVIIGLDHGGPWLKDRQVIEGWDFNKCMKWTKKSFEEAIVAGYDLIHVDPTVDKNINSNEILNIKIVVERTVELISHIEIFRKKNGIPCVAYEVGTEEVKGGLADLKKFRFFLEFLKQSLSQKELKYIWPCFVVGKVGTNLHTNYFDVKTASILVNEAAKYGSLIKGHYTDYVENLKDYPKTGIGGANIGPELTEVEFVSLMKFVKVEDELKKNINLNTTSNLDKVLNKAIYKSNRWKKWLSQLFLFSGNL